MIWMLKLAYKGFVAGHKQDVKEYNKSIKSKFSHEEITEIFRKYKQ